MHTRLLLVLGFIVGAIVGVSVFQSVDVKADVPVRELTSTEVMCPPMNLWNPDAGAHGLIACGRGYRAVRAENESAVAVRFCGKEGCTRGNYTTRGHKRCTTCNAGTSYPIDVYAGQLRCISEGADAGVLLAVMCGN